MVLENTDLLDGEMGQSRPLPETRPKYLESLWVLAKGHQQCWQVA